jgi:hypothetical protein
LVTRRQSLSNILIENDKVKVIKSILAKSSGNEKSIQDELKLLLSDKSFDEVGKKIMEAWELQAKVNQKIMQIKPSENMAVMHLIDEVNQLSEAFKKASALTLHSLEEEKKKLLVVQEVFKKKSSEKMYVRSFKDQSFKLAMEELLEENSQLPDTKRPIKEENDEDSESEKENKEQTRFFSILETEEEINKLQKSFINPSSKTELIPNKQVPLKQMTPESILKLRVHPIISQLMTSNKTYLLHPIIDTGEKARKQLPAFRDPNAKVSVWTLLKENVGKDLTQVTFPVYYNEPLSMLQKLPDFLEYDYLLRKANKSDNPHIRLVNIFATLYILYATVPDRLKKPFNPLLGETFEIVDGDIRCVLEQVSHHPPITALWCDSDDFTIWGHLCFRAKLSLSGFELIPTGPFNVRLKRTNEHFTFERPRYSVHNYIIGKLYFWINGEMTCTNHSTNDKITVRFKPKGWTSKTDYEVEGEITDVNGKVVYGVTGKWNSHLSIIDPKTQEETCIAKKHDYPESAEMQYYLSSFNINLNYLRPDMLPKLAPTDSRLRPDQRAYEYGSLEIASGEKNRLEEKQRARRRENQKNQVVWKPKWFDFEMSGNEIKCSFKTRNGYFDTRETGKWPDDSLDLYN